MCIVAATRTPLAFRRRPQLTTSMFGSLPRQTASTESLVAAQKAAVAARVDAQSLAADLNEAAEVRA